ncbi:class I SAM-dependent methyltransferase [Pseudonocardia sp. Cha107L01]|uniref:class I SAM-dependent methyltransferase n=1 Tax=Pseudonocardia sp. Cha107L01 TaxID=3457576 RepID=UPI00403EA1F2
MSTDADATILCMACGAAEWDPALRHGAYRYVACRRCRTGRIDPIPDAGVLSKIFGDSYFRGGGAVGGYADYVADKTNHARNARGRVSRMARLGLDRGPVVDVGTATGETLVALRDDGWTPQGVEISQGVAEIARARGFDVRPKLEDYLDALTGACAAVTFFQSLEHLPDPAEALRTAALLLRPGGYVVLETWDRGSLIARLMGPGWQQVSPPSVIWMFHHRAAAQMARRAGLRLRTWRASMKWISVRWGASMIGDRYPFVQPVTDVLARSRAGDIPIPYRLGDLVTCVLVR